MKAGRPDQCEMRHGWVSRCRACGLHRGPTRYAPAVPTADPSAYDWINQELAWFGVAACVTVATDATREQLAAAFGVDLSSPQPGILALRQTRAASADRPRSPYDLPLVPQEEPRMVSLTTIQGRQVAIEVCNRATPSGDEVTGTPRSCRSRSTWRTCPPTHQAPII